MTTGAQTIDKIKKELEKEGYDHGTAIATQAEVEAGAACGQLSIITEEESEQEEQAGIEE